MKTLSLTYDEFSWIARNVAKLAGRADTSKTAKLTRELSQKLSEDKLLSDKKGRVLVPVNRNDLRILQNVIDTQRTVLLQSVIPNYEERGRIKYAEYIKKAEGVLELLSGALSKVEEALR